MALTFYPHEDDAENGSYADRINTLMEAAERYKSSVLEVKPAVTPEGATPEEIADKRTTPCDFLHAYNWSTIAGILDEVRSLPEGSSSDKVKKVALLNKLAEVYEVLRGAKMPKLEAVRLALINEASQLAAQGSGEASAG